MFSTYLVFSLCSYGVTGIVWPLYYLIGIILCEVYLYPFLREETELRRRKEWNTAKLVPRTHSDVLLPNFSMQVQ